VVTVEYVESLYPRGGNSPDPRLMGFQAVSHNGSPELVKVCPVERKEDVLEQRKTGQHAEK
jgi:hypothetical protein